MSSPFSSFPFDAAGVDQYFHPEFINANRAPTSSDIYPPGTMWQDSSVSPKALYQTVGGGTWQSNQLTLSTDDTFAAASNSTASSSLAIKTYVDATAAFGAPIADEKGSGPQGIGYVATDVEAVALQANTPGVESFFLTPANLTAIFASPPATGGTAAAAGSFTTLSASGLSSLSGSATILTAGTALNLGSDNSGDAVNLAVGTTARTVGIANSAAAHVVSIGSVTGAASMALRVGTGNFTLEGNVASTYSISSTGINTGTVTIASGTGARTVELAGGGTGIKTINIGRGATADVIKIGTSDGAGSLDLACGTGNFTLEGATSSQYTISSTGANTGSVTIGSGTGARTVEIAGSTGVKTVSIAAGAAANVVSIGSVTGAASMALKVGTGNFTLEGNVASTYDISATGVNTGTVRIGSGTGARTVELAGGGTGAKTINIGAAASADIISIGSVDGAGSMALRVGTGNFILEGDVASTYDISATGVNTGTVRIGSGTGARTVEIAGGGTGAKTINIGQAASADVISIGSTDGAGSMALRVGTGNFTLEGATASTYAISNTGANTGQVDIAGGTGARTVNIAGSTGGKTLNLAAGAGANIVTLGSVTGASSLALKCGTGNFTLEGDVASTYDISATGINTGTVRVGSGTGARTVEIAGGGTGIKTINIGRGATADVISIGTTDGAGSLTLAAGTGNITMSGTVNAIAAKYVVPTGIDLTLRQSPILQSNATTGAAPTGATGDVNLMYLQEGVIMEQFILGAGQTIIAPRMTATGLNIALDQVNNEGAEYNFGAARANSQHAFTIGTSAAFRMDATFTIADVSGCEPLLIGFRKSEANNATITSYTDYATIGLDNVAAVGNVVISTELNAGGTTNTDTTDAWADAASHKLSVLVSGAGVVTYLIDDIAPSATAAFTFDNADVVVPFIHFLNGADVAGDVELEALKIGFQ